MREHLSTLRLNLFVLFSKTSEKLSGKYSIDAVEIKSTVKTSFLSYSALFRMKIISFSKSFLLISSFPASMSLYIGGFTVGRVTISKILSIKICL